MRVLERFLINFDSWPWSAVWRVVLGVLIFPMFRLIIGDGRSMWIPLVLFVGGLALLRLVPALLRRVFPFSVEAKEVWKERRFIAKRYDSYQWQKLFWIGLGLLAYEVFGSGLHLGEWLVTLICLVGGGAGLYIWRNINTAQGSATKA